MDKKREYSENKCGDVGENVGLEVGGKSLGFILVRERGASLGDV